jgi:hypothetical protein
MVPLQSLSDQPITAPIGVGTARRSTLTIFVRRKAKEYGGGLFRYTELRG